MKRYISAYWNVAVWIGMFILFVALCAWSGTVTTSTSIYPSVPSKGYVVHATSFTTAASAEVVQATTGKRIKVLAYELVANGTTNVKFTSGGADDIQGSTLWYLTLNSVVTKPVTLINQQPIVYMQTAVGASLSINLSAAQSVSGTILYYVE